MTPKPPNDPTPRFAFGRNWQGFAHKVDEDRIRAAICSLRGMLDVARLDGMRFLDAGCGSGLFSLAALRLGATVHSFDFDPDSVAATLSLKERFAPSNEQWTIERGSVLERDYLDSLGKFDVVYCWGVLHHTGDMWTAMHRVAAGVPIGGYLFLAIYNDQGIVSDLWRRVKRLYCSGPIGRAIVIPVFFTYFAVGGLIGDLFRGSNPLSRYRVSRDRGMSVVHDWIDWLGGYPFETANAGQVFDFHSRIGFTLTRLVSNQGLGCNQFVFRRVKGTDIRHGV